MNRPQSNSSTISDESRTTASSKSISRCSRVGSELALIEEHHRSIRTPLPVDEAGALVEPARHLVVLARPQLHLLGSFATRGLHRCVQQSAAESVAAETRDDVKLLEIGMEARRVDPGPEAQLRKAVRPVAHQEHDHLLVADQLAVALFQHLDTGAWLVVLGLEVVEQPGDVGRVAGRGTADLRCFGALGWWRRHRGQAITLR